MSDIRLTTQERRASIVEAAVEEFGRRGLEGATTDAIARRAGISQPYVIRLFGTKKALFAAAVDRVFATVRDAFAAAAAAAPPEERMAAMGQAYTSLLEDRAVLRMHLQAFAAAPDDDELRDLVRTRMLELHAQVGRATGADPDVLRRFFALGMLLNVVSGIDVPELLGGPDWKQSVATECGAGGPLSPRRPGC